MKGIRKGARVRVTYEGVVKLVTCDGFTIAPDDFRQSWIRVRTAEPLIADCQPEKTQIEVLEPPAREFEDGAYYLHPFGQVQRYCQARDDFYVPAADGDWRVKRKVVSAEILDGYVKLIPEGKK